MGCPRWMGQLVNAFPAMLPFLHAEIVPMHLQENEEPQGFPGFYLENSLRFIRKSPIELFR
jgi:hypothetical protein